MEAAMNPTSIREWFIVNNFHLRELINPYITLRNTLLLTTNDVFHDVIDTQYKNMLLSIIANAATKDLGCSYEEVLVELEELKWEKFFG